MKFKAICVFLSLVFVTQYSFGQSKVELEKKYGAAKFYEIRPTVLMAAKFDDDDRICEAQLQPIKFSKDGFHTNNNSIHSVVVGDIVDELAPPSTRGIASSSLPFNFNVSGKVNYKIFRYENIEIEMINYSFLPIDENDQKGSFGTAHVAIIKWKKRKCSQNNP